MKDLIYMAGALNSDSCGYIKNLHNMNKEASKVKGMGFDVCVPGNDFLLGYMDGGLDYQDYASNSLNLLSRCDALFVQHTEPNDKSIGTQKELEYAMMRDIPVLRSYSDLWKFKNRPKVLCIVGESGTGKSLVADYISKEYKINLIESYTTRPQRDPYDLGHTFLSEDEYDELPEGEMLAHTKIKGYRYCCLYGDLEKRNVYVIDENGLTMFQKNYKSMTKTVSLRVFRDPETRLAQIGLERFSRDDGKFNFNPQTYDYTLINNGTVEDLYKKIDELMGELDW